MHASLSNDGLHELPMWRELGCTCASSTIRSCSEANAQESRMSECQFADDAALLVTTREGAEQAMREYIEVASSFGLKVSIRKTKLMVVGQTVQTEDRAPIQVGDCEIECVDEFTYLGSIISSN